MSESSKRVVTTCGFEGLSSPSSASDTSISHVIGLSIEEFAPTAAALSEASLAQVVVVVVVVVSK